MTTAAPTTSMTTSAPVPSIPAPQAVEGTGLRRSLLEDLALKTLYLEGELNLRELADKMGLSLAIVDDLFQHLRKSQLCEVKGMVGSVHRVSTTSLGKTRAQELLAISRYVGTAPVSLSDYAARVREQSVAQVDVNAADLRRALSPLVLSDDTLKQLGIAVLSGTSVLLHGPSGTGKTAIAERVPRIYQDSVWIPYAVEVDNQIITVYDATVHRRLDVPLPFDADKRWVLCERPRVIVGGELIMEMLDLLYSPASGFYAAPVQMKANNGVLVIDDFGRQRISPEELLNRWIVPLDRRIDYLTLGGGRKFEIPFELFVVFSTNYDPKTLFTTGSHATTGPDDAFLRRIPNKIHVSFVPREHFHEIFRGVCGEYSVAYDGGVVDRLVDFLDGELKEPLRPCYPRDLVRQICWEARFEGRQPVLDWQAVTRACHNYFLAGEAA